jgi:hypothetical protein
MYFPDSILMPGKSAQKFIKLYYYESIESKNDKKLTSFVKITLSLTAFPGWRYKINYIHQYSFHSYVVHEEKEGLIPLA